MSLRRQHRISHASRTTQLIEGVSAGAVLGLLLESGGLIAAMAAHAVIDLIILFVARAKLSAG